MIKIQVELNRCRMYVFLHAIPLFTSGMLPEAQYVECKWVWSGLVTMVGRGAAVRDSRITAEQSQAVSETSSRIGTRESSQGCLAVSHFASFEKVFVCFFADSVKGGPLRSRCE